MKYFVLSFAVSLVLSVSLYGQIDTKNKAVIYVYSGSVGSPSPKDPRNTIYLDDKPIADIGPKRFFIVVTDPGSHSLSFKNKKDGGIERDFAVGSTTYLSMGWTESGWTRGPRGLTAVPEDNGRFSVKALKPLETKYIREKTFVFTSL